MTFTLTRFADLFAKCFTTEEHDFESLYESLRSAPEYPRKDACPLIKLATFGDLRATSGSLRHDGNLLKVHGVEVDYDAGTVSFDEAQERLALAGINAVLYTTASYTAEKPRWRCFCPLSRAHSPADRVRFAARLNGVLGGILAPESFKLSQAFYVGRVVGVEYRVAPIRGGACIDELHALDDGAIGPLAAGNTRADRLAEIHSDDPVIGRLAAQAQVLRHRPDGAVDVVCPFEGTHTTPRSPADCTYFPAHTGGFANGHFKCMHAHCASRSDSEFLEALGLQARGHDREQPSWPADLAPEAHQGLLGDIADAIKPHTEGDDAAILLQSIAAFGASVGRGPHVRIEGDEHHPLIFTLMVGKTAKARKGTSWGRVRQIFEAAAVKSFYTLVPRLMPPVVDGASSAEGLIWQVRDSITKSENKAGIVIEVVVDNGVTDKRLILMETEFAQVLKQSARPGNTLSPIIRATWDKGDIRSLTKNSPAKATGAHIAILGQITEEELRRELSETEQANGLANRFLFMLVQRSKQLPFGGGDINQATLDALATRLADAVRLARTRGEMKFSAAARDLWVKVYPELSEGKPGLFGMVTARAEAQVVRLSLIYALADQASEIDLPHLQAALAVWERCEASARYIFGSSLGDADADKILEALRERGTMTRTAISGLFQRHRSPQRIDAALERLEQQGQARHRTENTKGRTIHHWDAC